MIDSCGTVLNSGLWDNTLIILQSRYPYKYGIFWPTLLNCKSYFVGLKHLSIFKKKCAILNRARHRFELNHMKRQHRQCEELKYLVEVLTSIDIRLLCVVAASVICMFQLTVPGRQQKEQLDAELCHH